jgi:hypothetical protein
MKTLFFTILVVISLAPAQGKDLEPTVNLLLRGIRAELPKGWTASYDKRYTWLEISREEAVLSTSALPNGPPDEKSEPRTFAFAFRVMTAIPPNEHRQLSAQNRQIQKEASALYEDLKKRGLQRKFDSFGWKTVEDKRAVARYEALKKSLHSLPEFHFRDISLEWGVNSPDNPIISVTDDRIRDECTRVQEKVIKLLSKYDVA